MNRNSGLGPLYAVFDADREAHMKDWPLTQRFRLCPGALYHIEVRA